MQDVAFPIEQINQAFLLGVLKIDPVIADRTKKIDHSLWRSLFKRGEFPFGQGIVERVQQFEGPLPDQGALTGWAPIKIDTTVDAQGNVVDDPCNQQPSETMKIGFTTRTYTGHQRAIKTDWICLNEIKWKWQFAQQLQLTFEGLADFSLSVWDNHAQKSYMALGRGYALTPGLFDTPVSYDPFSGANLTVPSGTIPELMTVRALRQINTYYSLQAQRFAIGGDSGAPVFGLITHPDDMEQMIMREGPLYQAFLHSKPEMLIEGYGKVKDFQQWAIMYDLKLPRFRLVTINGAPQYEPVLPYLNEPTNVGQAVVANPAYVKAEFTVMGVYIKDMFDVLTPPFNPASPGGGTSFNVKPSYNGEFAWRNIMTNSNENFWGEKGRYVARYQAFNKPGPAVRDMSWFLVRRSAQIPVVNELGSGAGFYQGQAFNVPTPASSATIVDCQPIEAAADGTFQRLNITLSAKLTTGIGGAVTLKGKTNTSIGAKTVLISSAAGANEYKYEVLFAAAGSYLDFDGGLIGGNITC